MQLLKRKPVRPPRRGTLRGIGRPWRAGPQMSAFRTAQGGPRVQGPPRGGGPPSGLQLSPKPSNPVSVGRRGPLPVNLHPLFKDLRAVGRPHALPDPPRRVGDAPIFPDALPTSSATPTGSANSLLATRVRVGWEREQYHWVFQPRNIPTGPLLPSFTQTKSMSAQRAFANALILT